MGSPVCSWARCSTADRADATVSKSTRRSNRASMGFADEFWWRIGPRDKDAEDHGVTRALHPCSAQVHLNEFRMQGRAVKGAVPDDQSSVGHLEHPVEIRPHVGVVHVEFVLGDQPAQKRNRRSRIRGYRNGLHGLQRSVTKQNDAADLAC